MPLKRIKEHLKSHVSSLKNLYQKRLDLLYLMRLHHGANLGLASSGIFSNPAVTKALIAGGTRFATDDEADIKDIGITAEGDFPTALEQFSKAGVAKIKIW